MLRILFERLIAKPGPGEFDVRIKRKRAGRASCYRHKSFAHLTLLVILIKQMPVVFGDSTPAVLGLYYVQKMLLLPPHNGAKRHSSDYRHSHMRPAQLDSYARVAM